MIRKSLLLSKGSYPNWITKRELGISQTDRATINEWYWEWTPIHLTLFNYILFSTINMHDLMGREACLPGRSFLILRKESEASHGLIQGSTREQRSLPWKVLNHRQSFTLTGVLLTCQGLCCVTLDYTITSQHRTLPRPLVALTHHLLFGAPCWRCHHLKMSPCKYQQNHPIYL